MYDFVKEITAIEGLSFFPRLMNYSMDADTPIRTDDFYGRVQFEVSDLEIEELKKVAIQFKNVPINIVEIGVYRNGGRSFTHILLNKHPQSKYLGIDINDKSFLDDDSKNIFTLKSESIRQEVIRSTIKQHSMEPLSILLIDAWHSVNMAINDWRYSDLIVKGGYVVIHDVHMHPGPKLLVKAIDRSKYEVSIPLEKLPGHFGIAIAKKL